MENFHNKQTFGELPAAVIRTAEARGSSSGQVLMPLSSLRRIQQRIIDSFLTMSPEDHESPFKIYSLIANLDLTQKERLYVLATGNKNRIINILGSYYLELSEKISKTALEFAKKERKELALEVRVQEVKLPKKGCFPHFLSNNGVVFHLVDLSRSADLQHYFAFVPPGFENSNSYYTKVFSAVYQKYPEARFCKNTTPTEHLQKIEKNAVVQLTEVLAPCYVPRLRIYRDNLAFLRVVTPGEISTQGILVFKLKGKTILDLPECYQEQFRDLPELITQAETWRPWSFYQQENKWVNVRSRLPEDRLNCVFRDKPLIESLAKEIRELKSHPLEFTDMHTADPSTDGPAAQLRGKRQVETRGSTEDQPATRSRSKRKAEINVEGESSVPVKKTRKNSLIHQGQTNIEQNMAVEQRQLQFGPQQETSNQLPQSTYTMTSLPQYMPVMVPWFQPMPIMVPYQVPMWPTGPSSQFVGQPHGFQQMYAPSNMVNAPTGMTATGTEEIANIPQISQQPVAFQRPGYARNSSSHRPVASLSLNVSIQPLSYSALHEIPRPFFAQSHLWLTLCVLLCGYTSLNSLQNLFSKKEFDWSLFLNVFYGDVFCVDREVD